MINALSNLVTAQQVGTWLIIFLLVSYFLYKEWPELKNRMTSGAIKEKRLEETDRTVLDRLTNIENEVKQVNVKLERDYYRINEVEKKLRKTRELQADVNEELEIIMRALLDVLKTLQDQGANGATKESEKAINDYLNKKSHPNVRVDE